MTEDKEIRVLVDLSLKEAHLLKIIREHPFGKITVNMNEGQPLRVIIESSKILTTQDGMVMAQTLGKQVYGTGHKSDILEVTE